MLMAAGMQGKSLTNTSVSTTPEESEEESPLDFKIVKVHGKEVEVSLNSLFLPDCKVRYYAIWLLNWK